MFYFVYKAISRLPERPCSLPRDAPANPTLFIHSFSCISRHLTSIHPFTYPRIPNNQYTHPLTHAPTLLNYPPNCQPINSTVSATHAFTHPLISMHQYTHPLAHASIHLPPSSSTANPSTLSSIHPPSRLSTIHSTHLSTHPSLQPPTHHPLNLPSIHPPTCPPIHSPFQSLIRPHTHPFPLAHPFTHSCIDQPPPPSHLSTRR